MRNGTPLSGKDNCPTPLAEVAAIGEKLGISGTPALIFPNGTLVPGAIPLATIEENLAAK